MYSQYKNACSNIESTLFIAGYCNTKRTLPSSSSRIGKFLCIFVIAYFDII